jgi:hypothetical protein
MTRWAAVASAVLVLGLARPCDSAQDKPLDQAQGKPQVDVDRLPVSVLRIQRQLTHVTVREQRDGLKLRYFIDVYGQAPPIELFIKGENLVTGPVPYGAPTHQEILNVITPREFRAPVMDFRALLDWLAKKKDKK